MIGDYLDNDGRAVSPVIGVILMVAITVILAAVIGAFVLGIGPGEDPGPQATLSFSDASANEEVTVSHRGGDTLEDTQITVDGDSIGGDVDGLSAGTSQDIDVGTTGEVRVRIIHEPSGSVIGSGTVDVS